MRGPTWPRDYHKKTDHKWYNNRHGLDAYYFRNIHKHRSTAFMTGASFIVMLLILIFCGIAVTFETTPIVADREGFRDTLRRGQK